MIPIFGRSYRVLALKICKRFGIVDFFSRKFKSIGPILHQAELYITLEEYISTALLTLILTSPFVFLIFHLVFSVLYSINLGLSLLISFVFTIIYCAIFFIAFFTYPSYRISNIKRDIELNLPYATTHMATIAGTGVPIYLVFRIVGSFKEYGEVSKECRRIARNIEVFGYDTLTALSNAASETPAVSFKDLLWGIVSIMRTGGDLRSFLMEKARIYMENQKNIEEEYIDNLSLMAEIYTTVFVAGPVLFVVMATIMGSMGSLPLDLGVLFTLVIYILIPVMSIAFILLIEATKPVGAT